MNLNKKKGKQELMETFCGVDSVVEEDWEEGESVEADGVMEIVTECWVEPQNGVVAFPSPHAQHLNNCNYRQLAQAVSTLRCCGGVVVLWKGVMVRCVLWGSFEHWW